ncbi:hypothetical protein CHELA1G11_12424 [Hyphomicrobiales bacterium]|nr:hypothetical protein CHELA1G2_11883 [Hyphomicrobiales bacterium]CAH1664739.1 hypothetical protein CHELA1G11_12424 [Hyphomicrobiales bacterium]
MRVKIGKSPRRRGDASLRRHESRRSDNRMEHPVPSTAATSMPLAQRPARASPPRYPHRPLRKEAFSPFASHIRKARAPACAKVWISMLALPVLPFRANRDRLLCLCGRWPFLRESAW